MDNKAKSLEHDEAKSHGTIKTKSRRAQEIRIIGASPRGDIGPSIDRNGHNGLEADAGCSMEPME